MRLPNLETQERAVSRVAHLVRNVSAALDAAGIPYAVIGGNAVAAWVATVDEDAVRATKDVDLLVRRSDMAAIAAAVEPLNLYADEAGGIPVLLDRDRPKPSAGVHLIYADEKVRSRDLRPAPDVTGATRLAAGFKVIDLASLVRMKLEAFRRVDQVHLEDMLRLGLIDRALAHQLPSDLLPRLREVRDTMDWSTPPPEF